MRQTTLTPVQRVFLTPIRLAAFRVIHPFIILSVQFVSSSYQCNCFHRCVGVSFSALWCLYPSPFSPKQKIQGEFYTSPSTICSRVTHKSGSLSTRSDLLLHCQRSTCSLNTAGVVGIKVQLLVQAAGQFEFICSGEGSNCYRTCTVLNLAYVESSRES